MQGASARQEANCDYQRLSINVAEMFGQDTSSSTENATIYFGYGSNLWRHQMTKRCRTSEYLGIARLNGYRWLINDRGYANIVEVKDEEKSTSNLTWGMVYSLQRRDEEQLDINEGVPVSYTKENLTVDFWPVGEKTPPNVNVEPKTMEMLVYIDRKRTLPSVSKEEYIFRMNQGIKDARAQGIPQEYVDEVLRKFIPDTEDPNVAEFAARQAVFFEDED